MEINKINIYAKIDEEIKNRATMYITKNKLVKGDIVTLSKLIEESLEKYMIDNPL